MKKFISIGLILVILFGQFGMVGLAEEETPEPDDTVIVVSNVKTYEAKNEDESKNLIKTKDNFKLKITLEVKFGYGGIEKDNLYVQIGNSSSFTPSKTGSKVQAIPNKDEKNFYCHI